jgi:SET domain-containing protein
MLTVKTVLKETGVKGIGLFAAEPIPKGYVWWRDNRELDRSISKSKFEALSELAKEFVNTYGTLDSDGNWYICLDNARFINHSDNPNTSQANSGMPTSSDAWITTSDIPIGEEITIDYRQICTTCKNGLPFANRE